MRFAPRASDIAWSQAEPRRACAGSALYSGRWLHIPVEICICLYMDVAFPRWLPLLVRLHK